MFESWRDIVRESGAELCCSKADMITDVHISCRDLMPLITEQIKYIIMISIIMLSAMRNIAIATTL